MVLRTSSRRWGRLLATSGVLMAMGLGLSACGGSSPGASGVIRAVGAENQYANLIAQIGGRYVSVSAVMSNPNTDPHTFEVSTGVARSIAAAQLVVQNGVGYDTFMNQMESASYNSSREVIEVQSLLSLKSDTKNPHLWYNPRWMKRVARAIDKDLITLDPHHAAYFARRLTTFTTSLHRLETAITSFKKTYAGSTAATTEPVADYLLKALGLKNLTPFRFQADVMNGVDPSPEDIAFQQSLLTRRHVEVFCFNAQVSSTVTTSLRALATSSHVPVVAVYETMPTPGYDYQSWMLAEIHALAKALKSRVSTKEL